MLSILIPVYNWNITSLVQSLQKQLQIAGIEYEMIILDDASPQEQFHLENKCLATSPYILYERKDENTGRAKLRNELAAKANYPYLLFIDCDASIVDSSYISNYLENIGKKKNKGPFVILGGVAYRNTPPDSRHDFRWYYGKKREEIPAEERNKFPYKSFTPFNVLITKSLFDTIRFDEGFTSYGYEDTFFGTALKKEKIPVYHIENPLYHDGLDENEQYFQKIKSAIDNLAILQREGKINDDFIADNRLLKAYFKCKKIGLLPLIRKWFKRRQTSLQYRILEKQNLFLLDLYKLGYLAEKSKTSKF